MFRPIIEHIFKQCSDLHRFHLDSGNPPAYNTRADDHLLGRAASRIAAFQPAYDTVSPLSARDDPYEPRDLKKPLSCKNAYYAASQVWLWSRNLKVTRDLAARLQEWDSIGGYIDEFEVHLLSYVLLAHQFISDTPL